MALIPFAWVCFLTALVLQFWWIRRLRRVVRAEPTVAVLPRAAKLAVLRYARSVALIGLLTALSVISVLTFLRMASPPHARPAAVRAAIVWVQDAKRSLDALHPYWFAAAGILVTIGLGVYTYRRRLIQCSAAFQAAAQAEYDRVVEAMNTDPAWCDLPPDGDMLRVWAELDRLVNRFPSLPEDIKPVAAARIEELRQILAQLDVARRMNVRLAPDAVEDARPETFWEWLACLIGGRRLLGSVGLGTRLLYRANLVLLVLGLIGFSASGVYQVLDDRLVGLQDLEVRIQALERLEDRVATAEKELTPEAKAEESTNAQASQSSSNVRFSTRVADMGVWATRVRAKVVGAKASRASFRPVDEQVRDLAADVKAAAARDAQERDLIAEIRKAADEAPPRPGSQRGPPQERAQVANLRDRLARQTANGDGPAGRLRGKADALKQHLAELDPETQLASLREEVTGLEKQYEKVRSLREVSDQALVDELEKVGPLRGREAEQIALRQRIAEVRAGPGNSSPRRPSRSRLPGPSIRPNCRACRPNSRPGGSRPKP